MTAPFTDSHFPEVVARVVFQMARIRARKANPDALTGREVMNSIISDLSYMRGSLLVSGALAATVAVDKGIRLIVWRDEAVKASRCEYGFRRCFYADYKATRRDPRVTNRGVRASVGSEIATTAPQQRDSSVGGNQ